MCIASCAAAASAASPARAIGPGGAGTDATLCLAAIAAADRSGGLPDRLLGAIGLAESGRADPVARRVVPWPWTINVGGSGRFFASKAEAVAAVEALLAADTRSIDVGCMQVNLRHHPGAFASLDHAFDPGANVAYAARFLGQLYQKTNSWAQATAAYHSQTPELGAAYHRRVMAAGALAAAFPLPARRRSATVPGLYTPAFERELERDAADRAARDASLRVTARRTPTRPGPGEEYTREFAMTRAQDAALRAARLASMRRDAQRGSAYAAGETVSRSVPQRGGAEAWTGWRAPPRGPG